MPKLTSVSSKLVVAIASIVLGFVLINAISLFSFQNLEKADKWNSHTYNVLDHSAVLIASVVDQETGVRGFLVSGDENFLEPYHAGKKRFAESLDKLLKLTSDNPAQQERLRKIGDGEKKWATTIAEREIRLGSNRATLQEARDIEASGAGKGLMDAIRVAHAEFETAERALLVERSAAKHETQSLAVWSMIIGTVIMVMLSIAIGWFFNANIAKAIAQMTRAMSDIAGGDIDTEVPHSNRADEVGAMAKAVNVFKDNAIRNGQLELEQKEQETRSEEERQKAQEEAIGSERTIVVNSFGEALAQIAQRNLSFRMTADVPQAYETLKDNFNSSINDLEEAFVQVGKNVGSINNGTQEIRQVSEQLTNRTESQAASVEETASAVVEINSVVKNTAERAVDAGKRVDEAKSEAENSGRIVREARAAMEEIKNSSEEITNITNIIDGIAFQTNLLALNAGVEAARAGEAGKGFAVVAQEVRELAQRCTTAAKDIADLIVKSAGQVNSGFELVTKTESGLDTIVTSVNEVHGHMKAIADAAQEQATGLDEINTSITQIDETTQQNACMAEEATAATHILENEVQSLRTIIGTFVTNMNTVGGASTASENSNKVVQLDKQKVRTVAAKSASAGTVDGNAAVSDDWEEF